MKDLLFAPALSQLLESRKFAVALCALASLHLILFGLKFPTWRCPSLVLFGLPCPGCGLTRASINLLHANWQAAFRFHALAPIFLLGLLLIVIAAVLPEVPRRALIGSTEAIERRTGVTTIFLGVMLLYWLARILILRSAFAQLMQL